MLLHNELNNNQLCNSCHQQVFVSMSHLFSPYIKGCYHSHWLIGYSYKKLSSLLNATVVGTAGEAVLLGPAEDDMGVGPASETLW